MQETEIILVQILYLNNNISYLFLIGITITNNIYMLLDKTPLIRDVPTILFGLNESNVKIKLTHTRKYFR